MDALRQIEIQHRPVAGAEHRRLIDRRQEAVRVHRRAGFQRALRIGHHDVGRQRLGFRSQAVNHPRAHARETRNDSAGEQLILRRGVDHHVAVAGADDRDIVDALGEVREQVGDFDAALAVAFEGALGAEQSRFVVDELILRFAELGRPLLAVELVQQRLGIEGVHVAWTAGQEQEDHRLGLGLACAAAWAPADCSVAARSSSCCSMAAKASAPNPQHASREKFAAIAGDTKMFGHDALLVHVQK